MIQEQRSVMSSGLRRDRRNRATSGRLLSSLLISIAIVLMLTLLETGIILAFNPFHMLVETASRLNAFFSLHAHTPAIFLIPFIELVIALVVVLLAARPVALMLYLRNAHAAQATYWQLYTPLKALTNIRKTTETYQKDTKAPTVTNQEERISI